MLNYQRLILYIGVFLACCQTPPTLAAGPVQAEHWDRNSAMAVVQSTSMAAEVLRLGDISTLADGDLALKGIRKLETRSEWPLPAREAALYQFTQSLAELPRDAVAAEVMDYLRAYQARVLVPHEDHQEAFIPLFNIRAAAAGVENQWQRLESSAAAAYMLASGPETLLAAYGQSASHAQRSGYLDAVRQAEQDDVLAVQNTALEGLETLPELTPLVAATVVISNDVFAARQLLTHGRGSSLAPALTRLGNQLQPDDTASLLAFAIHHAPAGNAGLAIAAWGPRLQSHSASRELLLDTLADPELGAAAALALSQNPDIQTIRDLQETAMADSAAGRRAQMALDLNREQLIGGNPQ